MRVEREPSTTRPAGAVAADPTAGVGSESWHDALVVGTVTFGGAYEGPPGCVHGGFIAGSFDEILGVTQSLSGQPGMTAQLDISYRSPTPLRREVHFRGRIERIDGRKIHAVATLHHGDVLCAEARGLFISMKPEVFERLMRDRAQAGD